MVRVWIWYGLRLGVVVTSILSLLALAQNPFAQPYVERAEASARLTLERAVTRQATPDWTNAALAEAVALDDLDRVTLLVAYAARTDIALDPETTRAAEAMIAEQASLPARAQTCAACFADPAACRTPGLLLTCNIPLELTVIGDLKVLTQAAVGVERIERLDVALALVGLGATALVVLTGGSSATLKVGASALRIARRMRVLRPGFAADLNRLADLPLNSANIAPYLRGAAQLDEVTDVAKLSRLGRIAGDLGVVRRETSSAEALFLLRHVDSADDAARLARVAKVAGPETRPAIEILGLSRASRAIVRLSDLALTTLALLGALAAQIAGLAAPAALRLARRMLRPVA